MESNFMLEPKNFSPIELYHGERWLLESGVITESTADTLMAYGYMVPMVRHVELKIDMDVENNFQSPRCEYVLNFPFMKRFLYSRAKKALASGTILGKLKAFFYIKLGAPSPATEDVLKKMALDFLPKGFSVNVYVK